MRLLIVSNRLPITVKKQTDGQLMLTKSVGGLATGMQSYVQDLKESRLPIDSFCWIGWPGEVEEQDKPLIETALLRQNLKPVYLSKEQVDKFYLGFCNNTVWPLFHNLPQYAELRAEEWEAYKRVNELFASEIAKIARPDDLIWVHDYHFLLLPELLRKRLPNAKIGFFLHIPFPDKSQKTFLPKKIRQAILKGLTGANVIGFHTERYRNNFLARIYADLQIGSHNGYLDVPNRLTRTSVFPMSIDTKTFAATAKSPAVKEEILALRKLYGNYKIILSMDRLDYTKGIIERLEGFEQFLLRHPEWKEKIRLVMILVPSRAEIENYRQTKLRIEHLIQAINLGFGTKKWQPIIYRYESLTFSSIIAHYVISNTAVVTPLIDGMNLIAKEYVASKVDQPGVLILSKEAGAAQELSEALIINPKNIHQIADSLHQALKMNPTEQLNRLLNMQRHLMANNVVKWADGFLTILYKIGSLHTLVNVQLSKAYTRIAANAKIFDYLYQNSLRLTNIIQYLPLLSILDLISAEPDKPPEGLNPSTI